MSDPSDSRSPERSPSHRFPPARLEVLVTVDADAWAERIHSIDTVATAAARAAVAAAAASAPGPAEVGIVFSDDATVQRLNGTYRGRDAPTNVLAFPAEDDAEGPGDVPRLLGDVVLAYETCAREASAAGIPLEDHLRHLVVHGVLHLLGFDHEEDAAAERMERLETAILHDLGVPDPYVKAGAP